MTKLGDVLIQGMKEIRDHQAGQAPTVSPQQTKHYYNLVIASVVLCLIVTFTSVKTINVFGLTFSINALYFPIIYVLSDVLTEVYGYALARRSVWYMTGARVFCVALFPLLVAMPPADSMSPEKNAAFEIIFGQTPIIAFVQIFSLFAGDIVNSYIMAKMKVRTKGEFMGARFVVSTMASEFVNSFIFYFFALGLTGIIPMDAIWMSILGVTVLKTLVEVICLPVSLRLARKLKQIEGIDVYDRNTNFNPLKL